MECGQLFRYRRVGDWYYVHSGDKFFKIRQGEDRLEFSGTDKDFIRHFFSLDVPMEDVLSEIPLDRHTRRAFRLYYGLRIIRQEPWECLLSYLCSIASNIPKIQRCLDGLARTFGEEVCLDEVKGYSLPGPNQMAGARCNVPLLKGLGLGFRSRYIYEVSQRVDNAYLESLRDLSYLEAKKKLMELPGVGEKVADCVLLFSLDFVGAFPVDRWIDRAIRTFYFKGKKVSPREVQSFVSNYFGRYGGYAQQYLFHYSRTALGRDFFQSKQ
ncbi:MAG: DNA-3-methyladenine glycosylase 2 family protein [Planctomycetes bacterium]|nr:DNA-3-methyladenine glycosylase 2 family protein [Planctomycetota bacterium]